MQLGEQIGGNMNSAANNELRLVIRNKETEYYNNKYVDSFLK